MKIFIFVALLVTFVVADFDKRFAVQDILSDRYNRPSKDSIIFKPHPLPCTVQITEDQAMYDARTGELDERIEVLTVHGTYMNNIFYVENRVINEFMTRPDVESVVNGSTMQATFSSNDDQGGKCDLEWVTPDHTQALVNSGLLLFTEDGYFSSQEPAVFRGKKCTKYFVAGPGNYQNLYADYDDYIIALETFLYQPPLNYTWTFEYKFEAPLSAFVFDKSLSGECDDRAYVPPKKETCPQK